MPAPAHLSEEAFRALLDERGVLRPGALELPDRSVSWAVFGQRKDARLDVDAIRQQASRFFGAKLGLTVDKAYGPEVPLEDAARVVVHTDDPGTSGTRLVYGRLVDAEDLAAADEAERRQGTFGMAQLAARCGVIWLVVPESDEDRAALTIAAVLASTLLGPILAPGEDAILGVRSARERLERRAGPYR